VTTQRVKIRGVARWATAAVAVSAAETCGRETRCCGPPGRQNSEHYTSAPHRAAETTRERDRGTGCSAARHASVTPAPLWERLCNTERAPTSPHPAAPPRSSRHMHVNGRVTPQVSPKGRVVSKSSGVHKRIRACSAPRPRDPESPAAARQRAGSRPNAADTLHFCAPPSTTS